jgi:TPR repeat protein
MRTLLALSLVALSSCKCASPSTVPVDAGASARVDAAKEPPKACPSFTACAAGCEDGGHAALCYEASIFAFGTPDAGRDLQAVVQFANLSCEGGDGRGCVRANRPADALGKLPAQCETGDAEACELLIPLQREHGDAAAADATAVRARALLEVACKAPEPFACARLGSALIGGRFGKLEAKEGAAVLERACEAGVAGACIELALALTRGVPPELEKDAPKAALLGKRARLLSQ